MIQIKTQHDTKKGILEIVALDARVPVGAIRLGGGKRVMELDPDYAYAAQVRDKLISTERALT